MTLERGLLLHKRYRIVETLGQGGMGSVYRAVDENLGVDVAVKENLFTTDEYARQFRLEAVILANLRHTNLPRVTDHFVIGDQGQYLVMDYIEGEDLRQRMERVGNVTEDEAILIGASICDALTYLHTRKPPILHRDIKPGNVKITPDGHIFLVDFGLAKVLHGSQVTTTGARAMTPGYSPPEQYGTARTDLRTDIYSLGATLYASLSGVIPEDGLARAMDNTQLTPLRKRNSKVSRRLAASIEKAMGVDPSDRFQNAEEFKRSLLGSKSKTQKLMGEYTVPPPPADAFSAREQEYGAGASSEGGSKGIVPPSAEPPPFKPPRKRRGGIINRLATYLLVALLLISAGIVALARFRPELIPPQIIGQLPPMLFPVPTATRTPEPAHTESATVVSASTITNTPVPATPTFTVAPTIVVPTATAQFTITPGPSPTASPTPMGGGFGQIAFASNRTGVPQIYLSNIDGSNLISLTDMEGGACQPTWAPDGMRLAFISPCSTRGQFYETTYKSSSLYLINADGTGLAPLTTIPGSDFDPAWSPDGERIAFTSLRDGFKQIYMLSLVDSSVTRLTSTNPDFEAMQPSWSPQGDQLVYVARRLEAFQVWTMTDTGQDNAQLARSGQDLWDFLPVWSPDGEYVLFSQRPVGVASNPWLMSLRYADRDTQKPTKLNIQAPVENVHFSPDGFWLVFEGQDGSGNNDIYYMTITGGDRTRLTNDPGDDFDPAWRPIHIP